MVYAHELRIGNWVQDDSGYVRVDGSLIMELEADVAAVDPISLSPEILQKAGFRALDAIEREDYVCEEGWILSLNAVEDIIWDHDDVEMLHDKTRQPYFEHCFPYLHGLQNLYFSLTGKELLINL